MNLFEAMMLAMAAAIIVFSGFAILLFIAASKDDE